MKNSISIYKSSVHNPVPAYPGVQGEIFEFKKLARSKSFSLQESSSYRMLFLRKGHGVIQVNTEEFLFLSAGECILTDLNRNSFYALEDSLLALWNPEEKWHSADLSFFLSLHPDKKVSSSLNHSFSYRPVIGDFLNLLQGYYLDGLIDLNKLGELKQRELLILFRHYYTREQLITLFSPFFNRLEELWEKVLR